MENKRVPLTNKPKGTMLLISDSVLRGYPIQDACSPGVVHLTHYINYSACADRVHPISYKAAKALGLSICRRCFDQSKKRTFL